MYYISLMETFIYYVFQDEYEDEYEDEEDIESPSKGSTNTESEEDPKVIKELIDLIKKAGKKKTFIKTFSVYSINKQKKNRQYVFETRMLFLLKLLLKVSCIR